MASSVRSILRWSVMTAASASSVVTTIGKKQTSAMIASFGAMPKPHQRISSGAMITGNGLRADQQRVERAPQDRDQVDRDRQQRAGDERHENAEADLRRSHPEVVPKQVAVVGRGPGGSRWAPGG